MQFWKNKYSIKRSSSYFINFGGTYYPLGDSISDETDSTQVDNESMANSVDEEEDGNSEVSSPSGDEHDNVISEQLSNQIPLQRIAMSVRYKKNRGSKILRGGWMVHFTNTDRTVFVFKFHCNIIIILKL